MKSATSNMNQKPRGTRATLRQLSDDEARSVLGGHCAGRGAAIDSTAMGDNDHLFLNGFETAPKTVGSK